MPNSLAALRMATSKPACPGHSSDRRYIEANTGNYVPNGSVSSNYIPNILLNTRGGGTMSRSTNESYSGSHSLYHLSNVNDDYTEGYTNYSYRSANAQSGETWTLSCWVKPDSGNAGSTNVNMFIFGQSSSNSLVEYTNMGAVTLSPGSDWTYLTHTHTLSNGNTTGISFRLDNDVNNRGVYWDDIKFVCNNTGLRESTVGTGNNVSMGDFKVSSANSITGQSTIDEGTTHIYTFNFGGEGNLFNNIKSNYANFDWYEYDLGSGVDDISPSATGNIFGTAAYHGHDSTINITAGAVSGAEGSSESVSLRCIFRDFYNEDATSYGAVKSKTIVVEDATPPV